MNTDANGLDETVVTEEEYQTSTAAWANGPHPEYAWKDGSGQFIVALSSSFTWQINPRIELVATGGIRVLDRQSVESCEHLDSTDLSVNRLDVRRPFAGFTAGVALAP